MQISECGRHRMALSCGMSEPVGTTKCCWCCHSLKQRPSGAYAYAQAHLMSRICSGMFALTLASAMLFVPCFSMGVVTTNCSLPHKRYSMPLETNLFKDGPTKAACPKLRPQVIAAMLNKRGNKRQHLMGEQKAKSQGEQKAKSQGETNFEGTTSWGNKSRKLKGGLAKFTLIVWTPVSLATSRSLLCSENTENH